jgi:hypothetical protein
MNTHPSVKSYSPSDFSRFRPSFDRSLDLLRRTLLAGLLVSLIWLSGLSIHPALAMPIAAAMPEGIASRVVSSVVEGDRMSALITCLPKQLSQPNLKRALSEMGNDQLERAFNLKANPKLSQAEIDLANCLNRQEL